jgi:integral membrane sensor domain MASE1
MGSGDSSAADVWRISLLADSIGVLIVLAVGLAVFYALRVRPKAGQ